MKKENNKKKKREGITVITKCHLIFPPLPSFTSTIHASSWLTGKFIIKIKSKKNTVVTLFK